MPHVPTSECVLEKETVAAARYCRGLGRIGNPRGIASKCRNVDFGTAAACFELRVCVSLAVNRQGQCFGTINVAPQSLNPVRRRLKLKQKGMKSPVFVKCSFPLTTEGLLIPSLLESKCLPDLLRAAALLAGKINYFLLSSRFFFPFH